MGIPKFVFNVLLNELIFLQNSYFNKRFSCGQFAFDPSSYTIAFTRSSYDKTDTDKYLFSHKIRIHLIITYLLTFLLNISSPFFLTVCVQRFCEPSVKQFIMFLTKADMFVCKQILRFLLLIDYIEFIHKKKQQKLVILQN